MSTPMKGLQEKSDDGGIFLVIKHGSVCEESKKEREGFNPITVVNPRTNESSVKYIKRYKGVEAMIKKIEWRDTGDQFDQRYMSWKIYMDANGTPCVLEIPFESRVSTRFMKLAENIDFSKPVEFRAWHDAKQDNTAFYVGQGGVSVPQKYTKENPGDCPPPVQRFNKWNFDDQVEFLHQRMLNVVIPAVQAVAGIAETNGNGNHDDGDGEPDFDKTSPEFIDDDVPF
jgi:hypothetical protein